MSSRNFDRAFALTLRHEGGWSDHPKDPGGATNLGVTIGTLSAWLGRPATKAEVRALTPDTVKPIYRRNYWDAIGADRMEPGFDFACYDLAVNSGPARALRMSRAITADTPEGRIRALCAARLSFLRALKTWATFGKGWARRVADVEAEALRMSRAAAPAPVSKPAAPPPALTPASQPAPAGFFVRLARLVTRNAA
jgi:lysozyme family protein